MLQANETRLSFYDAGDDDYDAMILHLKRFSKTEIFQHWQILQAT